MPILEHIQHLSGARAWSGDIPFESLYTAGIAGERWLRALRDEGKIYGVRCARCEITYVPARLYCERCFAKLDENAWSEVGPGGTLESFTVLRLAPDGSPAETPRTMALIHLNGADTLLVHELSNLGPHKPVIGMPVKAVLKPQGERQGSIRDIAYFEPG